MTEVIVESGAQGNREGFTKAVIVAAVGGAYAEIEEIREKIAAVKAGDRGEAASGNGDLYNQLLVRRDRLASSREGRSAVDDQNRRAAVEQQLGRAMAGLAQNQQALISVLSVVGAQIDRVQQMNFKTASMIRGLQSTRPTNSSTGPPR